MLRQIHAITFTQTYSNHSTKCRDHKLNYRALSVLYDLIALFFVYSLWFRIAHTIDFCLLIVDTTAAKRSWGELLLNSEPEPLSSKLCCSSSIICVAQEPVYRLSPRHRLFLCTRSRLHNTSHHSHSLVYTRVWFLDTSYLFTGCSRLRSSLF